MLRRLATPATFLLTSNDPSGFNLIDVLAYGSLGHAAGYAILAVNSLQVTTAGMDTGPLPTVLHGLRGRVARLARNCLASCFARVDVLS